jgi:adhesin/invasin
VAATSGGVATATLTAGTVAGQAEITAQAGAITDTLTVALVPGGPDAVAVTASRSSMPADGSATAALTVTVSDSKGNPVADGTPVTVTTTLGSLGASPYVAATSGGVATATLTAGTEIGDAEIVAQVGAITDTISIALAAGPAGEIEIASSRDSMPADGSATATLTVTVSDGYDHPVADGTPVTMTTTLGDLGAAPFVAATSGGVATATLAAGTVVGDAEITAQAGTITDTLTVALVPGGADSLAVTASRSTLGIGESAIVSATVTDAYGHAVADGTVVTFTTNLGEFPAAPYTATTDNGVATATFTAGSTLGTATVQAQVSGITEEIEILIDQRFRIQLPFIAATWP